MLKLFSLIASMNGGIESAVIDYNLTFTDCKNAVIDFTEISGLFVPGTELLCEEQPEIIK